MRSRRSWKYVRYCSLQCLTDDLHQTLPLTIFIHTTPSNPRNLHPRPLKHLMRRHARAPNILLGQARRVERHLGIGTSPLPFRQIARVDDQDAFNNLVFPYQLPYLYLNQRRVPKKRRGNHTFANPGNALGTTNTSGLTLTISPNFK